MVQVTPLRTLASSPKSECISCLQCFDIVGWAAGRASSLKKWGDGGGWQCLVWMEWHPTGRSVCLPPLIFPGIIKSRGSLLAPANPGGPRKRAVKRLCVCVSYYLIVKNLFIEYNNCN